MHDPDREAPNGSRDFQSQDQMLSRIAASEIHHTCIPSPTGEFPLVASVKDLRGVYIEEHKKAALMLADWKEDPTRFTTAIKQLGEYFSGKRRTFDLPLNLQGTPFQLQAWNALMEFPFGKTPQLRRASRPHQQPESCPRHRPQKREKPYLHHRPMPPCDREKRHTHRLRRRAGEETVFAGAGERESECMISDVFLQQRKFDCDPSLIRLNFAHGLHCDSTQRS